MFDGVLSIAVGEEDDVPSGAVIDGLIVEDDGCACVVAALVRYEQLTERK